MTEPTDTKTHLHGYLRDVRAALLWKLDGLGEREVRLPRTPTGTNLLGIARHCANVEIGYFGPTFGRSWPHPEMTGFVQEAAYESDSQADWWVPADVSTADLVSFCRTAWEFADETIADLSVDAPGRVPWWEPGRNDVTLGQVLVHVLTDVARHVGHADILREGIDGGTGLLAGNSNVPDDVDWPSYVARLRAVAEQFPER